MRIYSLLLAITVLGAAAQTVEADCGPGTVLRTKTSPALFANKCVPDCYDCSGKVKCAFPCSCMECGANAGEDRRPNAGEDGKRNDCECPVS